MYAYRGLRGISEVCALLTEYMHELELDSLESKNTNQACKQRHPEGWACRDKDCGHVVSEFVREENLVEGRIGCDKKVKARRSKILGFCRDLGVQNSIFEGGAIRLARFLRGACHTSASPFDSRLRSKGWDEIRRELILGGRN